MGGPGPGRRLDVLRKGPRIVFVGEFIRVTDVEISPKSTITSGSLQLTERVFSG